MRPLPSSRRLCFFTLSVLLLSPFLVAVTHAAPDDRPFVAAVFSDHMVLQREKPNRIWGWTQPGAQVVVDIADVQAKTTADAEGRWEAAFTPPPVGGPYQLRVRGAQEVEFKDVLVGDIWLCSGQSNMNWPLRAATGGEEAAASAQFPQIRLFRVPQQVAYAPATDVAAAWRICSPETAAEFSAVGFYFGRRLHQELSVPIGLVQAAVGGSPAESWMRPVALGAFPEFQPHLDEIARLRDEGVAPTGSFLMHWLDRYDTGLKGATWAAPALDDSDWARVSVPGGFADLGVAETPAIVWFRREIILPDPLPEGPARLRLGVIEKMDTTYMNGRWIGASSWVENPRNYLVPAEALRPGVNELAVRVFKLAPDGGWRDPAEGLHLTLGDGTKIPLAGDWKARLSLDAKPPHPLPLSYENYPTMPTVLMQGMIHPLAPIALTGAIWYQGEANSERAAQYAKLMPALIADWRALFRQPDFPFYLVSLPAFMGRRDKPGTDGWAELREAQAQTVARTANTGLAVTIDTGEADDIHPGDKEPVGERLALLALDRHYGRDVVSQGPQPTRIERQGDALVIHFSNAGDGLQVRGGTPEFALAGEDRQWHWAEVEVGADRVILRSPHVRDPVAARYSWQANPQATLFNSAGLPAPPFRTDDW